MVSNNAMTVKELIGMLDEFGGHLHVIVEIDRNQSRVEEEIFEVVDVSSVDVDGEVCVRIEWG